MIVTVEELNEACLDIVNKAALHNYETEAFFTTALYTGARAREILNMTENITNLTETNVTFKVEKSTEERTVIREAINSLLIERYIRQVPSFMLNTYLSLNYFVRAIGYKNWKVNGEKNETTHLFRHNLAKQMYTNGYTPIEIAEHFAVNLTTANTYINSIIEKPD